MKNTLKVGFVQNHPKILKTEDNLKECLSLLKGKKADLWVFPELFATGYNFKSMKEVRCVAEKVPDGRTCKALKLFSRENGCVVVAGLVEKTENHYFNSAVIVHESKVRVYRKTHLFGNEKKFFRPGNTGFFVQDILGAKIGVMICFDWFFPESARTLALKGTDIIVHPANLVLPWGPEGMRLRSLENHIYTVTANRIGTERELKFIGQSQIVDPKGKIIIRARTDQCQVGLAKIDLKLARNKKVTLQNHIFFDRRPKEYSVLTQK